MANKIALGNFSAIVSRTKAVLSHAGPAPDPFLTATGLDVFRDAVADGRKILPARYQQRYVDVLAKVLKQAEFALATTHPRDAAARRAIFQQLQVVFSIVAAPIVQLRSWQHQRELKAFLVEVSNIYRRFINDEQVKKGTKIKLLSPDLDPLGAFGHDAAGPFTLPASPDLPVAIVSKPANQRNFLPLWAADGHEVGGHDIYGAVEGFQSDLRQALEANLRAAFQSGRIKTSSRTVDVPASGGFLAWLFGRSKPVSMEDFMVRVWSAWLGEASADHAGLVNLGPMYLDSLMLLLVALRPGGQLSTASIFDRKVFRGTGGFEGHPIDIVRGLLNIEAIKHLQFKDAGAYAQALSDRLIDVCGGSLPKYVFWYDRKKQRVIDVLLSDFQAVLPVVVETMLDARLPALGDQSFGEILNWLDSDEAIVRSVSAKLIAGDTEFGDEVEPRHVVSASMLALEAASTSSAEFTRASRLIHDTGIAMLKEMYDQQCLLCSVTMAAPRSEPEADLNRLFQHLHVKARVR